MKRSRMKLSGGVLAGLAALFGASAAAAPAAYDRGNNQGVGERPRPDYDAKGVPAGGFRLFPSVTAAIESNDNVFATADNISQPVVEDTIARIDGSARLSSGWSRHALNLTASGGYNEYLDNSEDAISRFGLGADGRLDIHRDWRATFSASFANDKEARGRNDPVGLADPIEYESRAANAALVGSFNRIRLTGGGGVQDTDFEDGRLAGGGVFSQDFRDITGTNINGRVDLALSPDTAVFVSGRQDWREFDVVDPVTGFTRNFDAQQALAGASFDITRLIRGEIGVGYFWAQFDNPNQPDVDGFSLSGNLDWFPTLLTTIGFSAGRNVTESGVAGVASLTRADYGVQVDHELRRNIILVGGARYVKDDYNGIAREDDRTEYTAGFDWLVNRVATINARYARADQDSTVPLREFEQNRAWFGLTLRR